MHPHLGSNIVVAELIGRKLQTQALKAHAVVIAHRALVLLIQDVGQVAADERYIGRARQRASHSELPLVAGSVDLLQIPIGAVHVGDPARASSWGSRPWWV